jgi:quinol monooxygenase YgiN
MATQQVTVVAQFRARPGMEDSARRELKSLVEPTRSEPGCINYDLHQSADDPAVFLFYENWVSRQALDEHLAKPYLLSLQAKADGLFAQPVELSIYEMIS